MQLSEIAHNGKSKVERYGWRDIGDPGEFVMLDKSFIQIPEEYQRDRSNPKIAELTKNFSWAGFGVLVIVRRGGIYFVVDGQHRLFAALRRADVKKVPCLVFEFDAFSDEALTFLMHNTLRRPLTALERHKAATQAGDKIAMVVTSTLDRLGLKEAKTAKSSGQIKCLNTCRKIAIENQDRFDRVMTAAALLANDGGHPVTDMLLRGLNYLDKNVPGGITEKRLEERLRKVGSIELQQEARRWISTMNNSGEKWIGEGMLAAANKGLKHKFSLIEA